MDIMLSTADKQFKQHCKDFTTSKLVPLGAKYGETEDIPKEIVEAMAEAKLFKLLLPQELGGDGISSLRICLAREQLAGVYCAADVTLAMQGLGSYPISLAGTMVQKQKYLTKICNGEILTTFALTEPEAGSDVSSMSTEAMETADSFVINGVKRFISNGYAANIAVLFARTPTEKNPRAVSAFIVEKGMPGFNVHKRIKIIAPHDLVELKFENCIVPKENLLGNIGEGLKIALSTLDVFRMSVGAAAMGIGQAALDVAITYAKRRVQFGKPIVKFQSTQFKLAEMATDLDAARALVYRAAIAKDKNGEHIPKVASMAKYYATEAAFRIVDQALQIHGGLGVVHGSTVERLYREIRALRIYEGTTEIQKLVIAKALLEE